MRVYGGGMSGAVKKQDKHITRRDIINAVAEILTLLTVGFFFGLGVFFAMQLGGCRAHAAESIPRAAYQHRDTLIRAAHAVWGLDAPVAVLAAQVHTESLWKADAVSPAGAMGIAQIMPSTARWLPDIAPALRGASPAPYNPGWAIRAMCEYDLWLYERQSAMSVGNGPSRACIALAPCDRMSFALSGYNGGLGWVKKDRIRARDKGLDPDRWSAVAPVNAGRSRAAWKENRDYVRRIMARQALYAGWGPGVACE